MVTSAAWIAAMLTLEGSPFHLQGRVPDVAIDCAGLFIVGCWLTGLKPRSFDVTGYSADPDGSLKPLCDEHLEPIAFEDAQPGDALLCAWAHEKMKPRHLGILLDATPGRMWWLQAESKRYKKVIRTRLLFGVDGMRLVQAYRVPGVA